MLLALVLALHLVTLRTTDGMSIEVNADEIVAYRAPRKNEHFAPGAKCLLFMTDGRFLNIGQTCEEVSAVIKPPHA
jgi:hypothetical protein